MGIAIGITRDEHHAASLRALAARSMDSSQARRLLAIAMILQGASRQDAARQAGMDRQTLRDWVLRYNESGVEGLVSRKSPGAPPKVTEAQMQELRALVLAGPDPKVHKVIRWRCLDLRQEVSCRFSVSVPERTIGKWLAKLELTRLRPRPRHPKTDVAAQAAFKKRARIDRPPVAAETDCAILDPRGAAEKVLVDLTPSKNLVHGLLRTCEW